jgi:hypothetical protein
VLTVLGLCGAWRDHSGMVATRQPSGTVTLVFTDIEGSARLLGQALLSRTTRDLLDVSFPTRDLGEHR